MFGWGVGRSHNLLVRHFSCDNCGPVATVQDIFWSHLGRPPPTASTGFWLVG